jgi:glycosyltransferase involved in cell wall biosynthesis
MRVSVICTVLNEGQSVRRLMDSLVGQTRAADEVVIVDGGSHDATVDVLRTYEGHLPLRVIVEPGANISRGRNVAICAARGDIIACTDAGVRLDPCWLECLVAPFESSHPPRAVAGFFVAEASTTFELAMGAAVLPTLSDIKPETFMPSSRSVAFTKAAWEAAGRYPEWIDYCEDLIFDLRLRRQAGPFAWAPAAIAHFRPRGSLRSYFTQYYRYARGDGKADLWRKRHGVRYGVYLLLLPALLGRILAPGPALTRVGAFLALLAGIYAYCRVPFRRLRRFLGCHPVAEWRRALLLVPVIRATGDVAKMLGYPVGWLWRIRNWQRPEVHWRDDPSGGNAGGN